MTDKKILDLLNKCQHVLTFSRCKSLSCPGSLGDGCLCPRCYTLELLEDFFENEGKSKDKKSKKSKSSVEFVDYDGEYPNLCAGKLILKVDDTEYVFEKHALRSGGHAYFTDDYKKEHVNHGDWSVGEWPEDFPEELKREALAVINENVSHGCCGGCL